jgi:basic amino acid/polyamine antiporter, APA family
VGLAGPSAWVSFLAAAALAAVTGMTYAELASRIPRAGGASAYAAEAFRGPWAPFLTGLFVLASGVTSAATVSLAAHGYLATFLDAPKLAAAAVLIALMAALCFWGIRESAGANNVMTVVEAAGLLTVVAAGAAFAWKIPASEWAPRLVPSAPPAAVLAGAALAFYAFVGFEDLANLAEEAKDPVRDIPRAMLTAVAVSTVLYLAVAAALLATQPAQTAAASPTPLLDVLGAAGFRGPAWAFSAVALLAVCNTGLANFVMASRLLYGMAGQGLMPGALARVHPGRRTPWAATLAVAALTALLALTGAVTQLAQTTSLLLLCVFAALHLSLMRIRRAAPAPEGAFRAPRWVPAAGLAGCAALALKTGPGAWWRAAALAGVGAAAFYLIKEEAPPRRQGSNSNPQP